MRGVEHMSTRFVPCSRSTYIISVTGYEEKNLSGILYSPVLETAAPFENLMQMLLTMEDWMDQLDAPQRGTQKRVFCRSMPERLSEENSVRGSQAVLASFSIHVLFRQNASWQGNLVWTEEKLESCFRSVLELIGLLDEALTSVQRG